MSTVVNRIQIPHFDATAFPFTKLSAEEAAGQTSLSAESSAGFAEDLFAIIDDLGTERAEARLLGVAPNISTVLLASGTGKQHRKGAPLSVTPYDQIVIYRETGADQPEDSEFDTVLATIDADFESLSTLFEDASPPDNAWYKWKYKNSETNAVSDFMPPTVQVSQKYLYATPQEVMRDMKITGDGDDIAELIEAVCDILDDEIDRGGRLYYRDVTEVMDMIANTQKYFPSQSPITAVSLLEVANGDGTAWQEDTRRKYAYEDRIEIDTAYSMYRRQALRFTYTVGFFDKNNVPKKLNMYVRELVADWYRAKSSGQRGDIKSKTVGSYSVTYKEEEYVGSLRDQIKDSDVVAHYSRGIVFGAIQANIPRPAYGRDSIFRQR